MPVAASKELGEPVKASLHHPLPRLWLMFDPEIIVPFPRGVVPVSPVARLIKHLIALPEKAVS
jgi:hypothetical protein